MRFTASILLLLALAGGATACKRPYGIGDYVLVTWEGQDYPAHLIAAEGPAKFKVHYDGYDNVWDEVVTRERIKGLVVGTPPQPDPPAKVRTKALSAAQTNQYRIGDRVRVEWHGQLYAASVRAIIGQERYKIHYEGYGDEWDEIVGLPRIQAR